MDLTRVRMCSTNIAEDKMAKDTQNNGDERRHVKGDPQPIISRTQEKRLMQQLILNPPMIDRDLLDSEADRFKPGDSERLRKAFM